MKYKISDISKLLNVSSNTVRRYEDKGYINPERESKSKYRYYSDTDINKIINIRMFRKYGFSHTDISGLMAMDINSQILLWEKRKSEMQQEIEYLTHLTKRLDGNIKIVQKVEQLKKNFEIKDCVDMQYVLYKKNDEILRDKDQLKIVQEFMYSAPEVQPILVFNKENLVNNRFQYDIGWSIKTSNMEKFCIKDNSSIISYPKRKCVFTTLRLFVDKNKYTEKKFKEEIINNLSEINNFISENNMKITDNALGINAACANEDGEDIQYILLSIPIE